MNPENVLEARAIWNHPDYPGTIQDLADRYDVSNGAMNGVLQYDSYKGLVPGFTKLWIPAHRTQ